MYMQTIKKKKTFMLLGIVVKYWGKELKNCCFSSDLPKKTVVQILYIFLALCKTNMKCWVLKWEFIFLFVNQQGMNQVSFNFRPLSEKQNKASFALISNTFYVRQASLIFPFNQTESRLSLKILSSEEEEKHPPRHSLKCCMWKTSLWPKIAEVVFFFFSQAKRAVKELKLLRNVTLVVFVCSAL